MASLSSPKLLTILIVLLFVANAITIVSFWAGKNEPQPAGGGGPARYVIETLGFDAAQQEKYLNMAHQHQSMIRPIREEIKLAKDSLYELLAQPNINDSTKMAAIRAISAHTQQIDLITFDHFAQVRELCSPAQKKKFDEIIKKVIQMMGMPHPSGPPPDRPPNL